jgi:CubicO group peptidase (beta-lactamase class C family)
LPSSRSAIYAKSSTTIVDAVFPNALPHRPADAPDASIDAMSIDAVAASPAAFLHGCYHDARQTRYQRKLPHRRAFTSLPPMGMRLLLALALSFALLAVVRADDVAGRAKRRAFQQMMESGDRAAPFRSMDQVFPFRVIARTATPTAQLPRAPRKLPVTYNFEGTPHSLDDLLRRARTQGFLVLKGGAIIDERYFDGADENSRVASWSMAKSFTSTLLGLALADGKIKSLDDSITSYLPELKPSAYYGVPIKYLLQMSSGVAFTEDDNNPNSDIHKMWAATMVEESQSLRDYAISLRQRSEHPGDTFVYRSIDTAVLGMLVNRVTGKHLADLLSQEIWQPLGMEHDATWLTDKPDGVEAAYCCINATLRDYGRFGLLFLHRGKSGDKQIVPESWIDEATNPQSAQVG